MDQLKITCLALLTAAALRDDAGAFLALEGMRAALAAALDVTSAIAIAGELLATDAPSRAAGVTAA